MLLEEQRAFSEIRKKGELESFDKILFNSELISKKVFFVKMILLVLLILLSITLIAYVSINSSYLLPYTTMGTFSTRIYFNY